MVGPAVERLFRIFIQRVWPADVSNVKIRFSILIDFGKARQQLERLKVDVEGMVLIDLIVEERLR